MEEPSFDPRSWVKGGPERVPAPPAPARATPARPPRGAALGLAAGVLVLGAVAAALFLTRQPAPGSHKPPARAPIAAAGAPVRIRRSFVVARLSDLAEALKAAGAADADAAATALREALGGPGASPGSLRVAVELDPRAGSHIVGLEARPASGPGWALTRTPAGGFTTKPLASDVSVQVKAVRGEMDANSFYTSAVAAGVTDSLIQPFAAAFAFDFDFQREIRPGDIFEAVFEHPVNADGQAAGGDQLLYASLQTAQKSRALYWFKPADGPPGWFDGNGRSIVRSLMRTPVEGARISSTFGMRVHPVLGYTRMHKGVDFATPVGTPVYASGDGVIDFMGPHDGHGNFVKIRHNAMLETGYAHLSKFGDGLRVGSSVRQGQEIALSGNTGLSSGPHMHYEVIVNGEPVDPLTFQTESGRTLNGSALLAFFKARDRIDALRAAQHG